jgi:hypothetical protein
MDYTYSKLHSWASSSRKITSASMFQSGTEKCRTASPCPCTGLIPASLFFLFFIPYQTDRIPEEPAFHFKKFCIVISMFLFASVSMSTVSVSVSVSVSSMSVSLAMSMNMDMNINMSLCMFMYIELNLDLGECMKDLQHEREYGVENQNFEYQCRKKSLVRHRYLFS